MFWHRVRHDNGSERRGLADVSGSQGLLGIAEGSLPAKLELLWSFKTGGAVKSSAAIQGGKVFVGSTDEQVYGLNFADGKGVEFQNRRTD